MKGLNGWMRRLERNQAAVLSTLLKELDRITATDESSAIQLADVILKDASLTSSIIKIGNSVQFNPSTMPVKTVSRAILNIGFKHIRSYCLSIKVLEAVLKEHPSPLLVSRLATTLHGAAQAKELCDELPQWKQEEVYVATLMSQLAELLVLGTSEKEAEEYKEMVEPTSTLDEKNKQAEKILGVSFTRLSKTLMKTWRIEGPVLDVLSPVEEPSDMVQAINLGNEISRTALYGWDSPEFNETLKRVAEFKDIDPGKMKKSILGTADDAAKSITQYGRAVLNDMIPTSKKNKVLEKTEKAVSDIKNEETGKLLEPDSDFQLKVLQDLTSQMMSDFNINKVFKSVLLGMNKGVGLERSVLAIFDKTQQKLVTKYVQGEGTDRWRELFVLRFVRSHSGFLYNLFEQDDAVWTGNESYRRLSQYLTGEFKGITGTENFFIAPLKAKGKRIGIIYADMGISNRPLTKTHFEGYCHFIQQVKLALTVLASKSK